MSHSKIHPNLSCSQEGAGEQVDASGDEVPNELNAEEVIDIGALAEVQDKVFEAPMGVEDEHPHVVEAVSG